MIFIMRAVVAGLLIGAIILMAGGCAKEFVPTLVEVPKLAAPPECAASVPGDLLPLPKANSGSAPEDVAASWATIHRRNRAMYRDALQKRTICKEYLKRARA
jgi:hypothetical protein